MSTPPPPPPPPNENFPPPEDPFANGDSGDQAMSQGTPSVAASPGRTFVVLGVLAVVLVFLLYNIFFSGSDEVVEKPPERTVAPTPIEPPPLPEEPIAAAAPPVFTPIDIPQPAKIDLITPEEDSAAQQQRLARMRSDIIAADNTGGLAGVLNGDDDASDAQSQQALSSNDPNSAFEVNVANVNEKPRRVNATRIGNLRRIVAQGRIIQATMESALNTELPAPIRAIVSRDTYGEAGTEALIPKGSRLIGTYNTDITGAQSRVYVVWTRVIRPDGVDVMLGSPLVDQIGQAGIGGQVDTKFQQMFSRAVMASIISIGFAIGSDELSGGGEQSTTTSTFGTTQSGDAASTATVNALNRLGSTTDTFLQRFIPTRSTILVDQGTPVNVFVNRDLVFPGDTAGTHIVN